MDLVTGYYGEITTEAVATFQQDNGIHATGMYGAVTRMALASRLRSTLVQQEIVEESALTRVAFAPFSLIPY
jgi:peptidoglycan hydrolase-like protein with peptidoglycan-binding domain